MLFRRRKPAGRWEQFRTFLWPRRSFVRSLRYFAKRTLRLHATPHAIAAGIAAGVFASFTPFLGFHLIIAAIIAYFSAGNVIASAFGTAVGNPLTFPFIWGMTLETGRFMLTGNFRGEGAPLLLGSMLANMDFVRLWEPILKPMTFGALPVGLVFAFFSYVLTRWTVMQFKQKRKALLADKARKRAIAEAKKTGLGAKASVQP